jgi:hypothetical protein
MDMGMKIIWGVAEGMNDHGSTGSTFFKFDMGSEEQRKAVIGTTVRYLR